jgi:hypothetical protein
MDRGIANTLEALANLIYLARATLDDKERVDVYLAIADASCGKTENAQGPLRKA